MPQVDSSIYILIFQSSLHLFFLSYGFLFFFLLYLFQKKIKYFYIMLLKVFYFNSLFFLDELYFLKGDSAESSQLVFQDSVDLFKRNIVYWKLEGFYCLIIFLFFSFWILFKSNLNKKKKLKRLKYISYFSFNSNFYRDSDIPCVFFDEKNINVSHSIWHDNFPCVVYINEVHKFNELYPNMVLDSTRNGTYHAIICNYHYIINESLKGRCKYWEEKKKLQKVIVNSCKINNNDKYHFINYLNELETKYLNNFGGVIPAHFKPNYSFCYHYQSQLVLPVVEELYPLDIIYLEDLNKNDENLISDTVIVESNEPTQGWFAYFSELIHLFFVSLFL